MPWTDSQNQAIEALERDVCVSAGAGAGKTGVLVARFLRIVRESAAGALPEESSAGVGQILVITFTDKATREMKERIVSELTKAGLREERREIETAYISTIHSFCSRLLKENPFEAGVDPEYQVLDENDARRLLRSSFETALEQAELDGDDEISELAAAAQNERVFGADTADPLSALLHAVESGLSRIRGAGVRLDQLEAAASEGSSGTRRRALLPVLAHLGPVIAAAMESREALRGAAGAMGALEARRRTVIECLKDVRGLDADSDWADVCAAIKSICEAGARAGGSYHIRAGALPDEAAAAQALGRIRAAANEVRPLADLDADSEQRAAAMSHRFLCLLVRVWSAYDEAKRHAGALDNDDLQARAVFVLESSEGVRLRYGRLFRHILVDEFQDTNPLQMKLLRLLHSRRGASEWQGGEPADRPSDGDLETRRRGDGGIPEADLSVRQNPTQGSRSECLPNSLFVVGDVQQSIYGFRDADPSIFQGVERRFRRGGPGRHVVLAQNYRSRPEILRFINRLFEQIWQGGPITFTPLTPGAEHSPRAEPSVEVLMAADAGRAGYVEREAAAIARRIRQMVEGQQVRISDLGDPRCGEPVGYRDIALLLRSLTEVGKYEEAFARAGVPCFIVGGGRGYYARREIRDVMNLLTVLDSPLDDIALVATLRSPMVGCEIDTIYALSRFAWNAAGDRHAPLYPHIADLLNSGALDGVEQERLARFYATAESLRSEEDRLPVGHLLERLVRMTDYDLRLLVRPNGLRRLANVRKLIQMANSASVTGVSEFIRRLRDLERISEREGDAPTEAEAADVVRIITVHRAKGLEFPVVFVGDMARGIYLGEPGPFLCDGRSLAVGCRYRDYRSASHRLIALEREQSEVQESVRVLYVALTRAREHLALCGYSPRRPGGTRPSWAHLVFPRLGILAPPAAPETRWSGDVAFTVAGMGSEI